MNHDQVLPVTRRAGWLPTFACLALPICLGACSGSSSGSGDTASGATTSDGASDASSSGGGQSTTATGSGGSDTTSASQSNSASDVGGSGGAAGSNDSGSDGSAGAAGACAVLVEDHPLEPGYHVTECSAIDYSTNPPCTGEHYPVWAAYQSYDFPVPRGYWVHSLEHGAIVITYNCGDGCPDEVAEVQGMIDALPADLRCSGTGVDVQVVMTPDPLLDVRWALSSWGDTLRADCVDLDAFEQFYFDHLNQGPEDICGGGLALSEDTVTPGCGE